MGDAGARGPFGIDELEQRPVAGAGVELGRVVLAEGLEIRGAGREELPVSPDLSRAIVAVDVDSRELRDRRSPIDVPARDRAIARPVRVFEDRRLELRRAAGRDAGWTARGPAGPAHRAFHDLPAVVLAASRGARLEVHLLTVVLTDVADPEVAGEAVERE